MDFLLLFATFATCLSCIQAQETETENEIIEIALTTTVAPTSPASQAPAPVPLKPGQILVQRIQNITAAAAAATKPIRDILPKCACNALTCECCVHFGFQANAQRSACARLNANFNDVSVILDLVVDDNIITSNTLAPSNFPICATYPPINVCFVANNIFIVNGNIKICSSLTVKVIQATVFNGHLPCVGWENGQIAWSEHTE